MSTWQNRMFIQPMKIDPPSSFGTTIKSLLAYGLGTFVVLLTAWGIGRSFYRRGYDREMEALCMPALTWYSGASYVWEEPTWMEGYDARTEVIALIILHSIDDDVEWLVKRPEVV